jgi:hypothetical protein
MSEPVIKKLTIMAPRIGLPMALVFAVLLFETVVLFQFKGKYEAADAVVLQAQQELAKVDKFISDDCNFQYVRITNGNVRLIRTIAGDQLRYDAQRDLAQRMLEASSYWSLHALELPASNKLEVRISQNTAHYWRAMAASENRIADVTAVTESMDKDAAKALGKQANIDNICKQHASPNPPDFIYPSAGP